MSETHCAVCGRLLTNPHSVRRGIGPVCWKNIHELEEEEMQKLEDLDELTKYVCPLCGKIIAKPDTPYNNYRGMLAIHVKHAHEELWKGELKKTLDEFRKKIYKHLVEDTPYYDLIGWAKEDPKMLAAFWRLVQPMYIQVKREEPSPKRDRVLRKLEKARSHYLTKRVRDYYAYMKEWKK